MNDDSPELVQSIRISYSVGGVEQTQIEGKSDPIIQLDVSLETFFVLESFQMQREHIRKFLDLHPVLHRSSAEDQGGGTRDEPLFGFLQSATLVAGELVPMTEHLARAELTEAGGDGRVGLDIDRQIEESFISRRDLSTERKVSQPAATIWRDNVQSRK